MPAFEDNCVPVIPAFEAKSAEVRVPAAMFAVWPTPRLLPTMAETVIFAFVT